MELNLKKTEQIILRKITQKSCFFTVLPNSAQDGFTLVETLIAISILLVSVVGPIGLIGDATHKIYFAKDEMIAINLAQEGVEAVRKVRDTSILAGTIPWDTGFSAGTYIVDAGNSAVPLNPITTDQKVYLDTLTGLYRQGAVYTPTQFSRLVTITSVAPAYERKVVSTVTWKTGGDTGTVSVSENLFKWTP